MNEDIRNFFKEKKLKQWQVADLMGIREDALSKKLRYELDQEEKQKIINVIESHKVC